MSVIIPAFNSATTIVRAIESCSDFIGCEIIVVDDGSTDQTSIVAQDAGARVISQVNSGAGAARRLGLTVSSSEYVIFLDADDELVPEGVSESIALLENSADASVAGGRVLGIPPSGRARVLLRSYEKITAAALIRVGFGPWPPAASVVRRSALISAEQLSIRPLSTRFAEDYEMVIRLSMVGSILTHDLVSTRYQLYSGKSSKAPTAAIRDKEIIRAHYSRQLGISCALLTESEIVASARARASRVAFSNGRYINSLVMFFGAVISSPRQFVKKLTMKFCNNTSMKRSF
ncbi:glycosyltransferase family 2 protein [Specibacter sp. NPDC057265]|uniref:glycosyltransferase family 2 protein n=1 Tax=Specibacter sp. NPDC057265 TaxID=3346075 RepID=UPI0036432D5C